MYGLLFAFLSPVLYAAMNVADKTIIVHRVKHAYGYSVVIGLVNLLFAAFIASFLRWGGVTTTDLLFPIGAGILLGIQTFIYVKILEEENVSDLIGFVYLYPLLVALLSMLFLGEIIPLFGYLGAVLSITGVLLLSVHKSKTRRAIIISIIALTLIIAIGEFFVKVSTTSITAWQGAVINQAAMGITLLLALAHPAVRAGFKSELSNFKWAILSEALTFSAVFTLYLAMAELPATVVSSIAAVQPLFVLIFENIAHRHFGSISTESNPLQKAGAILLIVAGVVLLTLAA